MMRGPSQSWSGKICIGHLQPPRPVVSAAVAPNEEVVRDTFFAQDGGKLLVLVPAHVVLARDHDVFVLAVALEEPWIAQPANIVGWIVKIDVVIVVAVEEAFDIEGSAHGDAS